MAAKQDVEQTLHTDRALRMLGRFSKWQVKNYLCCAMGFGVAFAWILMTVVFIGDVPNYRCALPPNASLNDVIPMVEKDGELVYESCLMYENITESNRTVPCQYGYWYDPESGYESTIVSQWDLVCGKEWLVEMSMTLQSVGKIIGAIFFNRLSDKYGRKMVYLGCLWANVVIASVRAFSPMMVVYTLLVFLGGIVQQGMICASFILAVEMFPTDQRSTAAIVIEFFWALGYMSVSPMAYFLRNWRYLELATALPFILTIPFYWTLSESIPWLVANDRVEEAEDILRKAAKMSNISLPENVFHAAPALPGERCGENASDAIKPCEGEGEGERKCESSAECSTEESNRLIVDKPMSGFSVHLTSKEEYDPMLLSLKPVAEEDKQSCHSCNGDYVETTFDGEADKPDDGRKYDSLDIFRNKALRYFSLVLFAMWFTICLCYTGINYTVTYLPGNRYLNFFFYGAMEIPAYAFAWLLAEKGSRRMTLLSLNLCGGLALVSSIALTRFDISSLKSLVIVLSMAGKLMITSSISVIYVVVPEIFPTNVRNIGMGLCQSFGRFGTLISPFARILHREVDWAPSVVIGTASVIAGFMALLLPETRHRPLPESMREVEAMRDDTSLCRRRKPAGDCLCRRRKPAGDCNVPQKI